MEKNLKIILVACETIQDEILQSMGILGLNYPVIWLEGGLHNNPERLRSRIKEVLLKADGNCDRLLITLGYCGGGVANITTGNYETILPLTDDCLSFLLGSLLLRKKASVPVTYFLTKGWLSHELNVVTSYENAVSKFSPATAMHLNRILLDGYDRFGLLDTGAYSLSEAKRRVMPLAEGLNLKVETLKVDLNWLHTFLQGPYDDSRRFIKLPPKSTLTFDDWMRFLGTLQDDGEKLG
jgi:hypothetical protein